MTYGEYHYFIKYKMRLKDGRWVTSKPNIPMPKKMPRDLAATYYTLKLSFYWKSKGYTTKPR